MERSGPLSRYSVSALLVGLVVMGSACTSIRVETDFDPAADFTTLETFQWAPLPQPVTGDARLDSDLLAQRVRAAVEQTLSAKGFRQIESGTPDFWVAWRAGIDSRLDVTTMHHSYNTWPSYRRWGGMHTTETVVREYEEGTLVVDVISPQTQQLVWRGAGQARLSSSSRTPEERTQRINEAVAQILESFPPL